MTEEDAVATVYDGLLGPESIPLKLRERRGLDRTQLARVEEAIAFLTRVYAERSAVPKRLAAAFVDVQGGMEQSRSWYTEAEQDEIQDAADRLTTAAYELLGE